MSLIHTLLGEMDETLLQKRVDVVENEDHIITATEYCTTECDGLAHSTGSATGTGSFCEKHIHRSVDMKVKRWPAFAGAAAASLT